MRVRIYAIYVDLALDLVIFAIKLWILILHLRFCLF